MRLESSFVVGNYGGGNNSGFEVGLARALSTMDTRCSTGAARMTIEIMDDDSMWVLPNGTHRRATCQHIMMLLALSMSPRYEILDSGSDGGSRAKGKAPAMQRLLRSSKNLVR
jgi:hypothetical protein